MTGTSLSLAALLRARLQAAMSERFDDAADGTMVVSLAGPHDMATQGFEGLSVWLYRVLQDAPRRAVPGAARGPASPPRLRLHYLLAPVIAAGRPDRPEIAQAMVGHVIRALHETPVLAGPHLRGDLSGTGAQIELRVVEPPLAELVQLWRAIGRDFELSICCEATRANP